MWVVFLIFGLMVLGLILGTKQSNAQNKKFKDEGMDPSKFIEAGKYLSGHTKLNNPAEHCWIYPKEHVIKIYHVKPGEFTKAFMANIDTDKITNISFEDDTTIQSRVGLKRLIALGIFAFAVKKKEKKELAYVIIEWNEGNFKNETVFEFEGKAAISRANSLRNKLINVINTGEGPSDAKSDDDLDKEILELLLQNKKMEAVKLYHDSTGATIKEAMSYVNKIAGVSE